MQKIAELIAKLRAENAVKLVCGTVDSLEGKMICEFDASDKNTLAAFLNAHNLRFDVIVRAEYEI
jgi:hypothetical protein